MINKLIQIPRALACIALLLGVSAAQDSHPAPPNIVLFLVDDLGWTDHSLEPMGSSLYETPNLKRLRDEGMFFTRAYAAHPLCSPTRASILTGKFPGHLRLTTICGPESELLVNRPPRLTEPRIGTPLQWKGFARMLQAESWSHLPLSEYTIAEALRDTNWQYATGIIGKWHLGDGEYAADRQGFEFMGTVFRRGGRGPRGYFDPPLQYPDEYIARNDIVRTDITETLTIEAIRFMEDRRNSARPFFLFLSHYSVHSPWQAGADRVAYYQEKLDSEAFQAAHPENQHKNPVYAAMVESVDRSLGSLLNHLDMAENRQMRDNTMIVFMSDNGAATSQAKSVPGDPFFDVTSNSPLRGHKHNLYEGGVRVPMVVRWPGVIRPGSTCEVPVSTVDFYPTLLGIAGEMPAAAWKSQALDGRSLLPLFHESGGWAPRPLFFHAPHYTVHLDYDTREFWLRPTSAIILDDWKLIRIHGQPDLLFNLRNDIGETKDLSEAEPKQAARLGKMLDDWFVSSGAIVPQPNPDYLYWEKEREEAARREARVPSIND